MSDEPYILSCQYRNTVYMSILLYYCFKADRDFFRQSESADIVNMYHQLLVSVSTKYKTRLNAMHVFCCFPSVNNVVFRL